MKPALIAFAATAALALTPGVAGADWGATCDTGGTGAQWNACVGSFKASCPSKNITTNETTGAVVCHSGRTVAPAGRLTVR